VTRIKVCGITNIEDALAAIHAGADALGFVFYASSPRYITPMRAKEIISQLPPFVTPVALFVNEDEKVISKILKMTGCSLLQFHGDETDGECRKYQTPYMKAIRVSESLDVIARCDDFPEASALLLDAYQKGIYGGSGVSFNWSKVPQRYSKSIVLAGGLTPINVQEAILQTNCYAVDVSGGVERAKGLKDHQLLKDFCVAVRSVVGSESSNKVDHQGICR
jgi:phosphoribosylanthranilate isomerase